MARHWRNALRRGFRAAFTRPLLDARGRQVPLYNSRRRMFRDEPGGHFQQAEFERVYRRVFPTVDFRRSPGALLVYAGVLGAGSAWLFLASAAPYRYFSVPFGAVVPACAVFGAVTTRRWFWGALPEDVARVMLEFRRCPACGYSLDGVPVGADGITTCPECAAAWRLPTTTAPGPVNPWPPDGP